MRRFLVTTVLCVCALLVVGGAFAQGQKDGTAGVRSAAPKVFVPTPTGPSVFCSTPNLPIPDNDFIGVTDELIVADSLTISDLDVSINTTHTFVGDLSFHLENKDTGTNVFLIRRPGLWPNEDPTCCGCSGDDIDCVVDDEGALFAEDQCDDLPAIHGNVIGGDPLDGDVDVMSSFDGENSAATWSLTVTDGAGADTGTLNEWCLIVDGGGICGLDAAMVKRSVRAGQMARVDVDVTHNRDSTVTVPFLLRIEDRRGRVITSGTTSPMTLNPGDTRSARYGLRVPEGTPAGVYSLYVSINEMAQGEAEKRVIFRVR